MVSRVWYGWTTSQNAGAYEALLKSQIFPGILAKKIAGLCASNYSAAKLATKSSSSL